MRNGAPFVQRLVWLMAQAVTSSLFPLSLGERGARTAKHLVSTFAPTLALRLSDWMDFTEAVDAYLKRHNAGPFFGTDFLLGDAK